MINKNDFEKLKKELHNLIFGKDFCPSRKKGDPEGNCK